MTTRLGLTNLLVRLREMTEAGTADYMLGTATYWSDGQLQTVLDEHRSEVVAEALTAQPEYVDGDWAYHLYTTPRRNLEEAASGVTEFSIRDSLGAEHGTAEWTANYDAGQFRWADDTAGSAFYLSTHVFDLNAAAAAVWTRKAGHAHTAYDFAADGASYKRSQMFEYCMTMAKQYREAAGSVLKVSTMFRSDAN